MNCQEAIERLPWWLNGSLASGERREVEEHLAGCAPCQKALGETRLAWEIYAQHIPTEALVAYSYDETPEGIDPALLERHLADCPQCAAELELVRSSRLLGEHEEVAVMPRRDPAPRYQRRRERGWQAAAVAAGLTSLVAIGGWVQQAQQTARLGSQNAVGAIAQREPWPATEKEAPSTIEVPDATVERGGSSRVEIPAGTGRVVLLVPPVRNDAAQTHSFSLRDASGGVRASSAVQLSTPLDLFTVIVDRRNLPRGDYTLQIYGGETLLRSIPVTVK